MIWVEITTQLRVGDFRRHGYNKKTKRTRYQLVVHHNYSRREMLFFWGEMENVNCEVLVLLLERGCLLTAERRAAAGSGAFSFNQVSASSLYLIF